LSLSNKDEVNEIKKKFVIDLLELEKNKATQLIKKVESKLSKVKSVFRSTFNYFNLILSTYLDLVKIKKCA